MQILSDRPMGVFSINTKPKPKTKHDVDTEIKVAIVIEIKSEINLQGVKKMWGEAKCRECE